MPLNIQEPRPSAPPTGFALFALGFRPFFLLAGVAAVALLSFWLHLYAGGPAPATYYGDIGWHSHEMLFGYSAAVVAGFLLTAVRNWTSVQTITGTPLALLAGLWLLARVLPFMPLPGAVVAAVDLLFLPALAYAIYLPISRVRQWRNLFFVPLLLAYGLGNLLVHLQVLGVTGNTLQAGNSIAIGMLVMLLAVMGGRVIGFFIERGLPGVQIKQWPWVEKLCVASVPVYFLFEALGVPALLLTVAALAAMVAHLVRVFGWYHPRIRSVSLLWVLYGGYAWIGIGFLLKALSAQGLVSPFLAIHAFTVGAIGVLTLGMMARVSLGHTGREMHAKRAISIAFALINIAALVRVVSPMFHPEAYLYYVMAAGVLWLTAFVLFLIVYVPVLWRPRVDGMPG